MLTHPPVHAQFPTPHGRTVVIHLLDQRMHVHRLWDGGDALGQALPLGQGDGRVRRVGPLLAEVRQPVDSVLALEVGQHRICGVPAFVQGGAVGLGHVVAEGGAQALG